MSVYITSTLHITSTLTHPSTLLHPGVGGWRQCVRWGGGGGTGVRWCVWGIGGGCGVGEGWSVCRVLEGV